MSVKNEGRFDSVFGRFAPSELFGFATQVREGPDVGFDLTYWPENQRFRSATTLIYDVEDRYQDPGEDDKYNFIEDHLEEARRGDSRNLYITFSSAVSLRAIGYSRAINNRLNDYLAESPTGRIGTIVMDYSEKPQELVSNVIKMNWRTGRRRVTASRTA